MNGTEKFIFDGNSAGFDLLDFWRFQYSNVFNLQEYIAEFIVAQALGIEKSQNTDSWTLFDIMYRNTRIEIKETSYYHPWNENANISKQRTFGITKANSRYESSEGENRYERQNDIYVFCLNTGMDRESSYPLNLNHWEFYIIPTTFINEHCGNNKTISLGRIRNFGFPAKRYNEIKAEIDLIINRMHTNNAF